MSYLPTIGLEVHAELKTKAKMFCGCPNDPEEKRPNVNICPICLAHPGALPVINKEALKHVVKVGLGVGGNVADFTEFDRKSYFYPDIPKGYQISQYQHPIVSGGALGGVAITRVHLEEDTARSIHEENGGSLIDYNRAGVPLMELVTEPVIHDAESASVFAKELQLLLRTLGASEANMEKGEMRVEANISVGKDGKLGTKVEVKNLNSFRSVARAIDYEVARHIQVLESGGSIRQETRGWDESAGETFPQREKESSHDYRYFPDPDLPKLRLHASTDFSPENLGKDAPELPSARRERLVSAYGLPPKAADVLVGDFELGRWFDEIPALAESNISIIKLASNYAISDLNAKRKAGGSLPEPRSFVSLMKMIAAGTVSSRGAKDILEILSTAGGDPEAIARERGLLQETDAAVLEAVVAKVIASNPDIVAEYKGGKAAVLQYLVGQAMKESKGSGNPGVFSRLLTEMMSKYVS